MTLVILVSSHSRGIIPIPTHARSNTSFPFIGFRFRSPPNLIALSCSMTNLFMKSTLTSCGGWTDRQTDKPTIKNKLKQKHNIGDDNDHTNEASHCFSATFELLVCVCNWSRPAHWEIDTDGDRRVWPTVCGSDRRVSAVNALMIVSNVCTALFRLTTMHRRSACL